MKIIRTLPDSGWTPISNAAARDHRLSWRARGLLFEILSYPDGWEMSVDDLVKKAQAADGAAEGRDAMRRAMRELVDAGYVERVKYTENGRWLTRLEVSDSRSENASSHRRTENPASVNQASETQSSVRPENPASVVQALRTKKDTKNKNNTPTGRCSSRGERLPEDFKITPEMVEWATEHVPAVNGRRETEKFVDYWRAQPGEKGVKSDWVATWRNWLRTAADRMPANAIGAQVVPFQRSTSSRPSTTDARVNEGLALAAKYAQLDAQEITR